jgi:hypothetical protein
MEVSGSLLYGVLSLNSGGLGGGLVQILTLLSAAKRV